MNAANWTQADTESAKRIWSEYEKQHDLSDRSGQIAGIDPVTGRVWLGEWITDVVSQRDADGNENPLFFVRVGFPTCLRKGGRR